MVRHRHGFTLVEVVIGAALLAVLAGAIVFTIFAKIAEARYQRSVDEVATLELGVASWILRTGQSTYGGLTSITALTESGAVPPKFAEPGANPWGGNYELVGAGEAFAVALTDVPDLHVCEPLRRAFESRAFVECPGQAPGRAVIVFGNFTTAFYAIRVAPTPSGGLVAGHGLSCGVGGTGQCTTTALLGAALTFTATPAEFFQFADWTGCEAASGAQCSVTVTSDVAVAARFTATGRLLTIATVPSGGRIEGPGVSCGGGGPRNCSEMYATGSQVTLSAIPESGFTVDAWTGCDVASGAQCTIALDTDRTVSATFAPMPRVLTISPVPANGIMTGTGIACGLGNTNCSFAYPHGAQVTLTATAANGFQLDQWSGACASTGGTECAFIITADATASAAFVPSLATLFVSPWPDGALVTATGISCGTGGTGDCTETYPLGSSVTLTIATQSGYSLAGWEGCSSVSGSQCVVAMTGDRLVAADVQPTQVQLNVSAGPNGRISGPGINCTSSGGTGCRNWYAPGTVLSLTATPNAGYQVFQWSGCDAATDSTCAVTLRASTRSVSGSFSNTPRVTLAISPTPTGGRVVAANDVGAAYEGINCGAGGTGKCADRVTGGFTAVLAALPSTGFRFGGWSGCTQADGAVCSMFMDGQNRTLSATFVPQEGNLVVQLPPPSTLSVPINQSRPGGRVAGSGISCGSLTVDDCAEPLPNGTAVTLTATPDAGYRLVGWSGCDGVNGATCTVTVSGTKTVTAQFDWQVWPPPDLASQSAKVREAADDLFKAVAAARAWAHNRNTTDYGIVTYSRGLGLVSQGYAGPGFLCPSTTSTARCSAWGREVGLNGASGGFAVFTFYASDADAATLLSKLSEWFTPLGLVSVTNTNPGFGSGNFEAVFRGY